MQRAWTVFCQKKLSCDAVYEKGQSGGRRRQPRTDHDVGSFPWRPTMKAQPVAEGEAMPSSPDWRKLDLALEDEAAELFTAGATYIRDIEAAKVKNFVRAVNAATCGRTFETGPGGRREGIPYTSEEEADLKLYYDAVAKERRAVEEK
jgi:hypothetical protein